MVTAARLLAHKSINGKYQSMMAMDSAPAFGLQMTHSMGKSLDSDPRCLPDVFSLPKSAADSFITDSANSATAIYSGKKATVNGLNMYTDSTGGAFNGPKFETVFEMGRRINHAQIGIVSTAFVRLLFVDLLFLLL